MYKARATSSSAHAIPYSTKASHQQLRPHNSLVYQSQSHQQLRPRHPLLYHSQSHQGMFTPFPQTQRGFPSFYYRWGNWGYLVCSIKELELEASQPKVLPSPCRALSQMLEELTHAHWSPRLRLHKPTIVEPGDSQSIGVECSGHKPESLSLVPGIHLKSWSWWGTFVSRDKGIFGTCWLANPANLTQRETLCQNNNNEKLGGTWERIVKVIL